MATRNVPSEDTAARNERLALLAHLQGMVEEAALPVKPIIERIEELLREVAWLTKKFTTTAAPLFADRINARLEAIAAELRVLNVRGELP